MRIVPVCLCLVGVLAAQPVTPRLFTRADGPSSDSRPLSSGTYRWQQVHDDMAGRPGTFSSLGFRVDDARAALGVTGYTVALNLWVSTAATTAATAVASFDLNHGADRRLVRPSQSLVNFPAVSGAVPDPRPFEQRIPFTQPFIFVGAGGLCWDVQVLSTSSSQFVTYDYGWSTVSNPRAKLTRVGAGCKATGYTRAFDLTLSASLDWARGTGTLSHTGIFGPLAGLGGMLLGGTYSSTPLPGTGSGVSGVCYLHTDIAFVQPLAINSGMVSFTMPLTLTPAMHGVSTLHQLFGLDAAANSLGIVTSNAFAANYTAPIGTLPVTRVSSTSNAATSGLLLRGEGLVVQLN